ncbi:MAG: 2-dehydropantoate 2-reductase [Desulfohalobiaceae bacterium]|nr:2-dehydropantoate 2-reductase [Desulfohalobiaceae bacterium]
MKITVIGAGAMGSLFGALLHESGTDVVLFDLWQEHVRRINQEGLTLCGQWGERSLKIMASSDPEQIRPADLVLVFVKSTNTPQAAKTAAALLAPEGLLLTLQNGMGNAEALAAEIDPEQILVGTTAHGAHVLGPGRIRHAGQGETVVGSWLVNEKTMARAEEVSAYFNQAGIKARSSKRVLENLWDKLLVNVGINAVTALTGTKNGQILDLEVSRQLSAAAIREASLLAASLGVRVRENPVEHVFAVAEATTANRSSMGQDVDRQRKTEIEAINGYVVREADKIGLSVPVNLTLTGLIQTLEAHYKDI